jgi:hypothetical protein
MVLRSTSSSSPDSCVCDSIGGVGKNLVNEDWVLGNNSSCQMVLHLVDAFEDEINILVSVGSNYEERTKKLSADCLEVLWVFECLKRYMLI